MKIAFSSKIGLSEENVQFLLKVNKIIEQYTAQGYKLTLRQLYYQLVSRDIIPNQQKEYKKLGDLLVKGRMAGVVDWDAIEDRVRVPKIPSSFDDIADGLEALRNAYRLDRQKGQQTYVEVWVEKDALSNVLERVTNPYHLHLMVNRGYSSATAMYDAFVRFYKALKRKQKVVILYLGDHDPSGLDMVRDVRDRVTEMLANYEPLNRMVVADVRAYDAEYGENAYFHKVTEDYGVGEDMLVKLTKEQRKEHGGKKYMYNFSKAWVRQRFTVEAVALTREQIDEYDPPPNPAKMTDTRGAAYMDQHGDSSWELDALPPDALQGILEDAIQRHIDVDLYDEVLRAESNDNDSIDDLIAKYRDGQ